ncbi:cyclic AMP-responsive element-binding protein 1-like isoform X2 [Halichondria panicea]|uniref:cyclic AMP-responsive element-binding protein 1-like isoform X2 n=1 Tax=Halichondria panicea TaxID=6063 RepID=UPI00312B4AED
MSTLKPVQQIGLTVEGPPDDHTTRASSVTHNPPVDNGDDDDDDEPSVLEALSDDQLARRPSFKKILDDLSSAGATLQKANVSADPLNAAAVATLQAQAALQQAASSGGMTNPAVFSGIFQGIHANQGEGTPTSSATNGDSQPQLSMLLPTQQQLQTAILNASSGVVQSLANQANIPASLLSSALINANMAATLSATGGVMNPVQDEGIKKRDVRLMKNREAARECRRKKKEYVRCLENRVAVLESQNQALIGELRALKELYLPKSQD